MSEKIDGSGNAVINNIRFTQQMSHPSSPSSGSEVLYVISGSAYGGLYLKDSAGEQIGPFITGSSAGNINTQTGTTYTTQDSDNGKVITLNNGSPITITVHQGAAASFNCLIIQLGAGQVTVAAGGTGAVRNYDSHTKLAGQYAVGSLFVVSNAGTAPQVYLAGNTGT